MNNYILYALLFECASSLLFVTFILFIATSYNYYFLINSVPSLFNQSGKIIIDKTKHEESSSKCVDTHFSTLHNL